MNFQDNAEKLINLIKDISQCEEREDYILNIHEPFFKNTNAWSYLKECLDSGWVSSAGKYIESLSNFSRRYTWYIYNRPYVDKRRSFGCCHGCCKCANH